MSRPARWHLPGPGHRKQIHADLSVAVIGGGIAGLAAATILTERGARVTLYERESFLGGRAGSWRHELCTGERQDMERGFHAFFRQYYNLRNLLRRVDPELGMLEPLTDYPIFGPEGEALSFTDLPHRAPFNVLALTRRTPSLRWRDLPRVGARAALEMLAFEPERTYRRFDDTTASDYLDSLRFPPQARQMLFSVFSHSFFNPEEDMSAGELLMMFHFYFMGNPEGLIFDVCRQPMARAIWTPLGQRLESRGADLRTGVTVDRIATTSSGRWSVEAAGRAEAYDGVVLALDVPALRALVSASPDLKDPAWRQRVDRLEPTHPFAVWRLWLDRPTLPGRAPFIGTTGVGSLDNISLFHLFQDESRAWARRSGGSVVELHAYAVDPDRDVGDLRRDLLDALHHLYPETSSARIVDDLFLLRRDCPAFPPGAHSRRPGVRTPMAGVTVAGDCVRLPFPSALMERAAASGMLAANHLLAPLDAAAEPLESIAPRGLLSPSLPWQRREVRA